MHAPAHWIIYLTSACISSGSGRRVFGLPGLNLSVRYAFCILYCNNHNKDKLSHYVRLKYIGIGVLLFCTHPGIHTCGLQIHVLNKKSFSGVNSRNVVVGRMNCMGIHLKSTIQSIRNK